MINSQVTVLIEADTIVASSAGTQLFAAPVTGVGPLHVVGTLLDEVITVRLAGGAATPPGGLNLQGGLGRDSLLLTGDGASLDLTDPAIVVANFIELDLSAGDATAVTIDAETVATMSPIAKEITIIAGAEDELAVADAANWLMTDPININGRFIRTATHQTSNSEVIQLESPSQWQNFLRHGDVNNDGVVTAVDALRIINELGRRTFSDPQTRVLRDATTVFPFPGIYFDHNGDGRASALDALRVINDLARQSLGGNSEQAEQITAGRGSVTAAADLTTPLSRPRSTPGGNQPQSNILLPETFATVGDDAIATATSAAQSVGGPSENDTIPTSTRKTESVETRVDDLLADTAFLDRLLR